ALRARELRAGVRPAPSRGVARQLGLFGIMVCNQGGPMDLAKLSDRERLVAEQAVLTLRALEAAAEKAPWGQGLSCLEAVIHDKGMDHLRQMMQTAASARPEAQKKGSPPDGIVPAGPRASSRF